MKIYRLNFGIIALLILLSYAVRANVKLPALVADNMVLQRDAQINLWGWADPGEKVSIQFLGKHLSTKASKDGKWNVVLASLPAGGPFEMVIKGKNVITIRNILIGDVWLASGQSNMEFKVHETNNSEEEVGTANFGQIRLFTVAKKFSFQKEQELTSDGWQVCSPTTVKDFSAVAFLFGREMFQKYRVPIGLINSSWGGTTAEAWTSAEGLRELPSFEKVANEMSSVKSENYENYKAKLDAWYKENGKVDRGRIPNATLWTDVNLNTSDWTKMEQPGLWLTKKELKGYNGTIWFRKEIEIPAAEIGRPFELNFGVIMLSDSLYFNGEFIGATTGFDKKRSYKIPASLIKAGTNLIVLRIKGISSFGGMVGYTDEMHALLGDIKIPLYGEWLYKTAPDLSTFPDAGVLTGFDAMMPNTPTVLFNSMISPLIPFTIKGVIWYQGESNADSKEEALQYYTLFPAMIKDWRKHWGYDFPFLFVQLAGYQPDKTEPDDYAWAHLREAQNKTLALPNTGMATAIDIGEEKNIHPKNKQDVAHRLALAAEKLAFNENVVHSGPMFKSMQIEGNKIRLSFDNIGSGLWAKDKYGYIRGFAIAGGDKRFVWAKAYQDGKDVIVYSDQVFTPVAVRYDWGNTPDGNLYNKENLPAVPFRTDNW